MNYRAKNLSFLGLLLAAGLASGPTTGQAAEATASASATILTPIAISKTTDLSFGVLTASAASTITIAVDDGARTATVPASLVNTGAAVSAFPPSRASFAVTGTPDLTFSISAPAATVQLAGPTGATAMAVTLSGVKSDTTTGTAATASTGKMSSAGTNTLYIGGSLVVPVANASFAGAYTSSAGIALTVAYN